jgi:hypothetical protein
VGKLPNPSNIEEGRVLAADLFDIVEDQKRRTMDASIDAETKALMLESLNHRKEDVLTKLVAYNEGNKRKASEMNGTSS